MVDARGTASQHAVHGLYAITPDSLPAEILLPLLRELMADGLRLLQLRRKGITRTALGNEGRDIVALAAAYDTKVIVNDDLALALDIGAHGVHWGRDDAASDLPTLREQIVSAKARAANTDNFIVGISCYDDFQRAQIAHDAGADYVAFGSFFASPTKPHAVRANLELLRQTRTKLNVPAVAIGGITRDNAGMLIDAGASALAVISDLFAPPYEDVVARARCFHAMFAHYQQTVRA
jgi:thiamine-phosphate pyrophosphorylase